VIPQREQLLQLARLAGSDAFVERFGPPQTAHPAPDALRTFVDEHLDDIAGHLVEEAAASDDVIDVISADSYLDDRLSVLDELLSGSQAASIRSAFRERIASWDSA
jgi:hypothetical protein